MKSRKLTITLSESDSKRLNSIVSSGKHLARTIRRAHVLLKLDSKSTLRYTNAELSSALDVSPTSVNAIVRPFNQEASNVFTGSNARARPYRAR